MTKAIPENVRRAASAALQELSQRCMRNAATLLKQSAYLLSEDPKTHGDVPAQLRRQIGFQMPGHDKLLQIEAALIGGTEVECRATAEARRLAKGRDEQRLEERRRQWAIESHQPNSHHFNKTLAALETLSRNTDDIIQVMQLANAGAFDGCSKLDDFAFALHSDFANIANGIGRFLWATQRLVDERFPPTDSAGTERKRPDAQAVLHVIDGGQS